MRTSCSPAGARMLCQAPSMLATCLPDFAPGMTHGLPALRGRAACTSTADGDGWDGAVAGFPIDDADFRPVQINMLPSKGEDLVPAAARQHQQADRCYRAGR